jgi:uncharacterized protein YecE (DUF72 family)
VPVDGEIRIGTSGWHYKHWRGPFYPVDLPSSEMLRRYERHFDTVEINNSFYRLPLASTFENWRQLTPSGFCFAVKASRYLTHMKRLKDPAPGLARFLPLVDLLREKLGPILFQLPPNFPCDAGRLKEFLTFLPRQYRYTFEFRDSSWHTGSIYSLLAQYGVAFCIYDSVKLTSPMEVTADFTYVRFHGTSAGTYDEATLRRWAQRIGDWHTNVKSIYVYFNNDQAGYAVQNAFRLRELLGG